MIVLIHAFPLSPTMYGPLQQHLETESVAITLPGFGGRPLPQGDPDLGAFAEDVAAQLPSGKVILGGCSLGGYVMMEMLRRGLVKPDGLILMDTKHTADNEQAIANRLKVADTAESHGIESLVETLAGPLLGSQSEDLQQPVRELIRQAPAATIAWTQRAMAGRSDSSETLASFSGKALVIVGEEDALAPVPVAQAMAGLMSASRLRVIARAGHLAPWERPEEVAQEINDWL